MTSEKNSCSEELLDVLRKLNLNDKFENKIEINEVLAVSLEENSWKRNEAYALLNNIVLSNSEALNEVVDKAEASNERTPGRTTLQKTLEDTKTDCCDTLSPLDVLIAVFLCCDPLLKQLLVRKMFYSCKLAIPFVFQLDSSKLYLDTWPLEFLNLNQEIPRFGSEYVLTTDTHVVSFVRIRRPNFSKSQILNCILTDQTSKKSVFFDTTCKGGKLARKLSDKLIEVFWLQRDQNKSNNGTFQNLVTLLNVRGELREQTMDLIKQLSDCTVIVLDLDVTKTQCGELKTLIDNLQAPLLLIHGDSNDISDDFKQNFSDVSVVFTTKRRQQQDLSEIGATLEHSILQNLNESNRTIPLKQRIINLRGNVLLSTNHDKIITESQHHASTIFKKFLEEFGDGGLCREHVTPASFKLSRKVRNLVTDLKKNLDIPALEKKRLELQEIRNQQLSLCTESARCFLNTLLINRDISAYIAGYLQTLIENCQKPVLSSLAKRYSELLNCPETPGHFFKKGKKKTGENEKHEIDREIENCSLTVGHILREIGHIYDSALVVQRDFESLKLPPVEEVAKLFATLIISGHSFELVDGDNRHMATSWIKIVFDALSNELKCAKIATVSVIGDQSSGKSSLLNCMFGLDMSTRSGKCTQGITVRLLPVQPKAQNATVSHILVIDSEGLRSPESMNDSTCQHHDNEFATFVTSLSDIELINIMGENCTPMKDILAIVVHAILRLGLARNALNIGHTCMFVHHNVTDIWAKDNMSKGFDKLLNMLNVATVESAKNEGITDVTSFNKIINFNSRSHVFTVPTLLTGNPPMGFVSKSYFEKICHIRQKVLNIIFASDNHMNLNDFAIKAVDVWNGVLAEDFVFSFQNNLELKAYKGIEKEVDHLIWQLEIFCGGILIDAIHKQLSNCSLTSSLEKAMDTTLPDLKIKASNKHDELQTQLLDKFESSEYKGIISQWKVKMSKALNSRLSDITETFEAEIKKQIQRLTLVRLTSQLSEEEKENIRITALSIARTDKDDKCLKNKIFKEKIWNNYKKKILEKIPKQPEIEFENKFYQCLDEYFSSHRPALKEECKEFGWSNETRFTHDLTSLMDTLNPERHSDTVMKNIVYSLKRAYVIIRRTPSTKEFINKFVLEIHNSLEELLLSHEELSCRDVDVFFAKLALFYKEFESGLVENLFDISKKYEIRCFITVCGYACDLFKKKNRSYQERHGIKARLKGFKPILQIEFNLAVEGRKNEEKVASMFAKTFFRLIRYRVEVMLPELLNKQLKCELPNNKENLIKQIYLDLMALDDFDAYIFYIDNPKKYATAWLIDKASYHLHTTFYRDAVTSIVSGILSSLENGLEQSFKSLKKGSTISEAAWFNSLKRFFPEGFLDDSYFAYVFHGVVIEDFTFFQECLNNCIKKEHSSYLENDTCFSKESTLGKNILAYFENHLVKFLWGCEAVCPFCKEPCSKSKHQDSAHRCSQHRPSCCSGLLTRKRFFFFFLLPEVACLEVCNYCVQSSQTFSCATVGFACKCEIQTDHRYKKYKDTFPDWDVTPSSNMYETSSFWMRFVAKHSKNLAKYFNYKIDVPSGWQNISQKDVEDSLEFFS